MERLKQGFDGFTLKILALIFMTFDHISAFLWGTMDIPIWFRWVGRISAPLFIYMVVEGFYHTRNRKKYMIRLYGWSVAMAIGNEIINAVVVHPNNSIIINNIFATMFLITVYLMGIEFIREGKREKIGKKIGVGVGIIVGISLLSALPFIALSRGANTLLKLCMTFIPTPLLVEGGVILIGLGIGFYLCRGKKVALSIFYSLVCLFNFAILASAGLTYENLFILNYQWLMIFALPFMLLYNGEKGRSLKHFFYIYYPAHCYILYILGIVMLKMK